MSLTKCTCPLTRTPCINGFFYYETLFLSAVSNPIKNL